MEESEPKTWQLVIQAAQVLSNRSDTFRLSEIIKEVRKIDPGKEWSSIQPIVQGMTRDVGKGPTGKGGKPFIKVSRGVYRFATDLDVKEQIIIPEGTLFPDRETVRLAGLHKHVMAGIGYEPGGSAESIVISGGYVDDIDLGTEIIYTGQGGRDENSRKQISDQELTRGNQALVIAEQTNTPIRVIRGSKGDPGFSPSAGYRYDGLFLVERHWFDVSRDGPLIVRFLLVKLGSLVSVTNSGHYEDPVPNPPEGNALPARAIQPARNGIVRDPAVSNWVKELYANACQFCGIILKTPTGSFSVGAHIQGLGRPHNGPDTIDNVLSLCPNCHILFDTGARYLLDDRRTIFDALGGPSAQLKVHRDHEISLVAIQYHRLHIAGIR